MEAMKTPYLSDVDLDKLARSSLVLQKPSYLIYPSIPTYLPIIQSHNAHQPTSAIPPAPCASKLLIDSPNAIHVKRKENATRATCTSNAYNIVHALYPPNPILNAPPLLYLTPSTLLHSPHDNSN
jgi:hypothetical protein